ncbi:Fructose-6-phosphate 2-kinase/fructose-2,6-bisphosphatase [Cavenderia fasciculata]|uniref:Fructose-6-phosphate 2-kinase/fructose-2,6-bisphosphatase n=1 Tax=Cavenderia fasciculata TaxID=261658 RepID=F4PSW8_CACFS|nr:Fructose-6-phosphate 2-kinase/fructose-2,6-bisphosphatase [Cavenderia fasciculata]EGG20757.1 Fructose-6-phosphate 2-kinase/fructose-2,6-bisphosphatase [Cavenderia fasciculata]|eukprot:XP_004358607.1 Fructose-6-phosphate 2-kinase/fructose-2,6-bisphosphatase [Cavenderia fasciculata]
MSQSSPSKPATPITSSILVPTTTKMITSASVGNLYILDHHHQQQQQHQRSASPSPSSSTSSLAHTMVIFFKVRGKMKYSNFIGSSLEDLNDVFINLFPEFSKESLRPFTIKHRETKIVYELDDIQDLYPGCILEMRKNSSDAINEGKRRNYVYTGFESDKIVIVMVGLPASGKTFIARKIRNLLNIMGISAKVFTVGEYRRNRVGAGQPAEFFDPGNLDGARVRLHMAVAAIDDMMQWLNSGSQVGIFDATNLTNERRQLILTRCTREGISKVIFVESIFNDSSKLEANMIENWKSSPDYSHQSQEEAVKSFRERISYYDKEYNEIDNDDLQYIKLFDVGKKIIANRITGYLPSRIMYLLMNLHLHSRPIWLCRAGASEWEVLRKKGGDPDLNHDGELFSHTLASWVTEHAKNQEITVWTSTFKRAIRTAQYISYPKVHVRGLDDIERGEWEGLTREEILRKTPEEFGAHLNDKLSYRIPRGECYLDVIQRLESVFLELERTRNASLIVSHPAPLRCLYGYITGESIENIPYIDIPLHTVISLRPTAYGCEIKKYPLNQDKKDIARLSLWIDDKRRFTFILYRDQDFYQKFSKETTSYSRSDSTIGNLIITITPSSSSSTN